MAAAVIQCLAGELSYVMDVALKKAKTEKKTSKQLSNTSILLPLQTLSFKKKIHNWPCYLKHNAVKRGLN